MSVAGNSGACCECNQLSGCDCETLVDSGLICQNKAEYATLCGFAEFTDPSVPPKKYRRRTVSGTYSNCNFGSGDSACASPWYSDGENRLNGSDQYDPDTCVLTAGAGADLYGWQGTACEIGAFAARNPAAVGSGAGWPAPTETPTTQENTANGICEPNPEGPYWRITVGDTSIELFDEDTEDDAEARARAAITDWSACTSCGITCSAFRTLRGAGEFTFGFRAVQAKVTWNAAIGSYSYKATVRFYRRVLGTSGPYLFYGLDERTMFFSVGVETAVETAWIDVPNEAGWETIAGGQTVERLP